MDLKYVNSLIDKYNYLISTYKLKNIFRLEQRIPCGLNKSIMENIGKLIKIKINRLQAYAEQMNKEEEIIPPLEDGEHSIKVLHRYVGSEEITDLGIHNIMVINNFAQIENNDLFPEDAIYNQYPWNYKKVAYEAKKRYSDFKQNNTFNKAISEIKNQEKLGISFAEAKAELETMNRRLNNTK